MEINEKLEVFFKAAIDAANSQSEAILKEQNDIYQAAMEEHEMACKNAMETKKRTFLEKQKKEENRRAAKQLMDWKKDYQKLREEKTEELFALVQQKLNAYKKTERYDAFLLTQIARAKEFAAGEEMIVLLSPSDSAKKNSLQEQSGCSITVDEQEFLGGIKAVIPQKNVLIDESFAGRLKQEKENCCI